MKLGFYVETNGDTPQNVEIYNFLNKEMQHGNLSDAAVFFNSINFNSVTPMFGMFDATELWHFTGNLITTSINNTIKAVNVVNKFNMAYWFNSQDVREEAIFELVNIASTMNVIVSNELDEKEFYRLTGKSPKLVKEFSLKNMKEVFDE